MKKLNKKNETELSAIEKEVIEFKEIEALKLIGVEALIILAGISMVIAVIAAFFLIWKYCFTTDVLYCIGYYLMFGTLINILICMVIEDAMKDYKKAKVKYIKIEARKLRKSLEAKEELYSLDDIVLTNDELPEIDLSCLDTED